MRLPITMLLTLSLYTSCMQQSTIVTPAAENITQEEVQAFVAHYDSAWNSKQVSEMDSLYGRAYVYFTSIGGMTNREANLEVLGADYYNVLQASRTELDIRIDGNTAIVGSRWQGNGLWKGTPFKDNQRCGLVIQKQQGKLKLLTEHCVEIKADTATAAE
ncbi:nuclear transport factor 2 family protein [Paraflavitalea pollutisoli]|uniref:nuclear transport factor 2 family protein n=1 Tax=Paraflavitalea pollutisoli TaxID=3034143 RepID=UPI0023EDDBF7|nr:nuclear transport factor 2 family protein [Paraflavitalea sp. H1-2-19X]